MDNSDRKNSHKLTEHFFRNEYGKIVSVITRYIGTENVETAEDIVQETLLKATTYWEKNGVPENPQAWLFATAKNLTLNILKRQKYLRQYQSQAARSKDRLEEVVFSEKLVMDEQLKMMFVCCHPSISEKSQIALILKILCGFSISEIASAFFSSNETINKQLVRARKKLRENNISLEMPSNPNDKITIALKTIYLLFNEGYYPIEKNELVRYDLCLEAIRLAEILISHPDIQEKSDAYALLALMYLNASRFKSRMNEGNEVVSLENQDRQKWDKSLINRGVHYLNLSTKKNKVSRYLILATISAHHCTAQSFERTDWNQVLSLYDNLLVLEDSPIVRLNRCVALAKVKGNKVAITELQELESISDIGKHSLFHSTLGQLYKEENEVQLAKNQIEKAITLAKNRRDIKLLKEKLSDLSL